MQRASLAALAFAENSSAYTVGRMNGDHWLLYLTPPQDNVLQPNALASSSALAPANPSTPLASLSEILSSSLPRITSYFSTGDNAAPPTNLPPTITPKRVAAPRPDQTLEILMSRLHPSVCASFYHPSSSPTTPYTSPLYADDPSDADAHALGSQLSQTLGITDLLPGATLDSFLFSPCGYSSNAVQGDRYATIHVTPEPDYSYASFETNLDFVSSPSTANATTGSTILPSSAESTKTTSLQELVEKVLVIFKPAKMSMTLFVSVDEDEGSDGRAQAHEGMRQLLNPDLAARYTRVDRILYEFDGYSLVYGVFELKKEEQAKVEEVEGR